MVLGTQKSLTRHLLILEDSQVRRTIILEDYQYSLGRKSSNKIVVKSQQISRTHATLLKKIKSKTNEHSYWIFDGDLEGNKSHNGIYVNGEKCLIHELKDGDLINFGCEVNASYHTLYNSDKNTNLSNDFNFYSEEFQESEGKITATNSESEQTNILFVSEPHMAVSNQETLPEQDYIDSLTKLPNQNLFYEYLSIAMGNAKQSQKPMAILYFDIEHLKEINKQFGELIGDQVLQEFGKQLKNCLRSGDIVARWGGDEFTILLPQINTIEDLPKICQRILDYMTQPLTLDGQNIKIVSSVGFAIYPQDGNEETMLLKKAEEKLLENKKIIKHQKQIKTFQIQNSQLAKIEILLQQALEHKEFSIYYQPQISFETNTIEGMEALMRWYHPQFGAISPTQFSPWIEKLDLVIPLTQWILETVFRQHQIWRELGFPFLPVSINLSSHQLQHQNFLKILYQMLSDTNLNPNLLTLEITEKTLFENPEEAFRVLHEVKQLGIQCSIDDFGSGVTSVRHLQQFPFDQLKIAQSLLHELKKHPEEISMIAAVIALGHTFKLKIIAEGVETHKQLDILRKLGCDVMQGYLFSQPLKDKDALRFLSLYKHKCTDDT